MDEHMAEYTIHGLVPGAGVCVAIGCGDEIPLGRLMCVGHWGRVPSSAKRLLTVAWRDWQEGRGSLDDLRHAQFACVEGLRL